MTNAALENAFKYADELGFKVFPIQKLGKRPVIRVAHVEGDPLRGKCHGECGKFGHGLHDATSDPIQIQKWANEFPGCNWAVRTGWESSVYIIDIDSEESSSWWNDQWLTDGCEVSTPRGGRHIYYAYDSEMPDLSISSHKVHKDIDTRGNGGYALLPGSVTSSKIDPSYGDGSYSGEIKNLVDLPEDVIALMPKRGVAKVQEKPKAENVSDEYSLGTPEFTESTPIGDGAFETPGGQRVIQSIIDRLDALPRPWVAGSGWHSAKFESACQLWRIARSPYFVMGEDEARELFFEHAPTRDGFEHLNPRHWSEAKTITEGTFHEHPGDVPVRLDPDDTLDKVLEPVPMNRSKIERLYWESKSIRDIKDLISELRHAGANAQDAYSVSYGCSAMKNFRKNADGGVRSTWGFVVAEYDRAPEPEESEPVHLDEEWGVEKSEKKEDDKPVLISESERAIIRDFPNFIDRYIATAKEMLAEPNLPLHYVNAWLALSNIVGDKGKIYFDGKTVPLSIWGMPLADSAAGKGDAKNVYEWVSGSGRVGGFGSINIGDDASAEALKSNLLEREGEVAVFFADEAAALMANFRNPQNFAYKLRAAALNYYDGKVTRALRSGMKKEEAGESSGVVFNMWLQTTWDSATGIMDEEDMQTGFVGRFLIAIGDEPKITADSLRPRMASEYQVKRGGIHPLARSLGHSASMRNASSDANRQVNASWEVIDRWGKSREDALEFIKGHSLEKFLKGILLRVTENFLKGAAVHALSEGRVDIEMTDLLVALKSGEYWIRDMVAFVDAIGSNEYRKRVEKLVKFIAQRPRSKAEILSRSPLSNLDTFVIIGLIERAESEGKIRKDGSRDKWVLS